MKGAEWREVNASLGWLLDRHANKRRPLEKMAAEIDAQCQALYPVMDRLCSETCPWCPDPCCLKAKIRWDLRDLLKLHLTGAPLPLAQPLDARTHSCRYLGPRGCLLARNLRPWICSWYVCPTQMARIDSDKLMRRTELESAILSIKKLRNELEAAFIRITAE